MSQGDDQETVSFCFEIENDFLNSPAPKQKPFQVTQYLLHCRDVPLQHAPDPEVFSVTAFMIRRNKLIYRMYK